MDKLHLLNLQGHLYKLTSYLTDQRGFADWLIVLCPVLQYFIL